eukprot:Lankesteria_metandrocarpae@DN4601_c0_g1_i4.p1
MPVDTAGGYCRWILPVDTAGGYCRWILPVDTAGGYCRWILPVDTAGGYCRWILLEDGHWLLSMWLLSMWTVYIGFDACALVYVVRRFYGLHSHGRVWGYEVVALYVRA